MKIVTSGSSYLDIDAYGGCIAYAELLQAQDVTAQAVSGAPLNESISQTVRSWRVPLKTKYAAQTDDSFILIDVSDPEYFDKIVRLNKVEAVVDHHVGFEQYWQERLGGQAYIEFIGAACTLVYERWVAAGLFDKMSPLSAKLLASGILDNTLNFGARVTTQRDKDAYVKLMKRADLPNDWPAQYFTECQSAILHDVAGAISNDTKNPVFQSYGQPIGFGQLAVWDAQTLLAQLAIIAQELSKVNAEWMMNLISIGERCSYFIATAPPVQAWLSQLLGVQFSGSVAIADHLWLRKEVLKRDLEAAPAKP